MKQIYFVPIRGVLAFAMLWILSVTAFAQKVVTGKVNDNGGSGIPGVSVTVKGTTVGSVTDADGNYSINVPASAKSLVFSSIGYLAQEITLGSQSVINIVLQDDTKSLDEVVVTGYSVTNKKESTAAVSIVKAKDLQAVPSGNIEQQLQGRVAGVTVITNGQPGTTSMIRVRGFNAVGGNEPLYIVDGVPVGSTDFLSPGDIESTTVLKDAAAASIYGARAANGVIVYTTRKGSKKARKMEVTYDGMYGVTDPNVAGAPRMLSPQQQADWTHIAYRNNAAANNSPVAYNHPQYGNQATATLPDYLHANGQNGVRGPIDRTAIEAAFAANPSSVFLIRPNLAGTNWYDEITRRGTISRHNLGFSGGSDNARYYVGMGLQDQDGILLNNTFSRYTFRANSEFDLGKRVRLGENLQFTYRSVLGQAGANGGIGIASEESVVLSAYRMPTVIPVYDDFGSFASTRAGGFNNPRNPVRTLLTNNANDRNFNANAFGNVYLEADLAKGLTVRSSLGGQYNNYYFKDYNYRYLGDSEPEANNGFGEGSGYSFGWVFTNTANYTKSFGKHNINVLAGIESLNTGKGRNMSGSGQNPFTMDLNYVNMSVVQNPIVNSNLFNGVNFYSLFSEAKYNYNEKYYVSAVIRRDGSSRFGANSRFGTFPAFSAAWRVTSEEFLKGNSFISDLKVRGGWGQMGNSNNVDPNNQFSLFAAARNRSFYPIEGQNNGANEGYFGSRIGNPNARWETVTTANIGFDATLLNGKWEVVAELWQKNTSDMLFNVPIPAVVGSNAAAPRVNIGSMLNRGIDLQVINRGKITNDLKYDVTVNAAFLQNEITSLAPGQTFVNGPTLRSITPVRNQVGRPISSFFGYQVEGYFNSQEEVTNSPAQQGKGLGRFRYADIDGDGVITPNDRTYLGSPVPTFTGGVNFGLQYKNWDFATYINIVAGNKIFNLAKQFTDFFGTFEGSGKGIRALESWTPALGNNAKAPIWESASNISTNGAENSWYVEDGSYMRLQNVAVGYTLSNTVLSRLGISKARISVSGNNFWTLTKYQGLDPAVGGAADTNFGIDVGNYPVTPSYNLGLNLSF